MNPYKALIITIERS